MLFRIAVLLALATVCCCAGVHRRMGCFVDSDKDRDLPFQRNMKRTTTQPACLNLCKSMNYKYYALQASDWCFCGNSFGRIKQVHDRECKLKCKGNESTTCGGHWRNEVFTTGIDTFTANRLGCFNDKPTARDLPEVRKADPKVRLTRQVCWDYCKGKKFKFFGVQGGKDCFCGNAHGKHGKSNEEGCYIRCLGDHTSTCGGKDKSEVYATGL